MSEALKLLASLVEAHCSPLITPHGNNLLHQVRVTSGKRAEIHATLSELVPAYVALTSAVSLLDFSNVSGTIEPLVAALDKYLSIARSPEHDLFVSQSDFKTSIIPEFLLRIADKYIKEHDLPFEATGQTDIPIEIAFDLKRNGLIVPRLQRVDFAIVKRVNLAADGMALRGFCVPLIGAEAKTYFDKNMITGVAYSVASLKTTFPHCVYIAIGEFADFELGADSYASSEIDEIYILRKQKRSDYRKTLVAKEIDPLLVREIISLMISTIRSHTQVHSDLKLRMPRGRLIAGNPDL